VCVCCGHSAEHEYLLIPAGMPGCDWYNKYEEDIKLMQQLGIKKFRLSIAWPRIFPSGTGQVNKQGLDFYSRVIDALLAAGIEPHVTLYHWDLPQVNPPQPPRGPHMVVTYWPLVSSPMRLSTPGAFPK
jgi:beta-glucosidase/6-phospho-beta-glucosidase/beta-galactosidase